MPYLNLVHLRDLRCHLCGAALAVAGARSFVVDPAGDPINLAPEEAPQAMLVQLCCPNGHVTELSVPGEIGAEEAILTPDDAPLGADAVVEVRT